MRPSPRNGATAAAVSSGEASSMTWSSQRDSVCAWRLRIARGMNAAWPYVGIRTEISGSATSRPLSLADVDPPRPLDRLDAESTVVTGEGAGQRPSAAHEARAEIRVRHKDLPEAGTSDRESQPRLVPVIAGFAPCPSQRYRKRRRGDPMDRLPASTGRYGSTRRSRPGTGP